MPFHLADKLVVNCAAQAFFKGNWCGKFCLRNSWRFEPCVLTELFYSDWIDCKFFMKDNRQKVKAKSAEICKSIRKVKKFCLWFAQCLVAVKNKMIHVVGRFVAVIEKVLFSGFSSVKFIFKAGKFFFVFNAELNKRRNVFNIIHALSVSTLPHHRKLSAYNLTQKVVDISPVLLAENHGRTDDSKAVRPVTYESQKKFSVLNLYILMLKCNIFYFFFIIYIIKS